MEDQVQNPTNPADQITPITATPNKEGGSVLVSEQEPNIHPEVAAAGVEAVSDRPELDQVHENIGVKLPGDLTPVSTTPSGKVQLPIDSLTEHDAEKIAKEGEGSNLNVSAHTEGIYSAPSILGLAVLKIKAFKRRLLG